MNTQNRTIFEGDNLHIKGEIMRKYLFVLLLLLSANVFTLSAQAVDFDIILVDEDLEPATVDELVFTEGPDTYQRVPDNIIGSSDFENMRDLPPDSQDYQLGRKVGWIVIPQRYDPTRYWICTGFLIGPDLFMTNHHCTHDDDGPLPLDGALIFMDYYEKTNIDPLRGGVTAGVLSVLRADEDKDYALLRLDRPIGNTYGWLELDDTTQVDSSQSVKIIQHPRGRSKEIVRQNSEIVDIPASHPLSRTPFALAYLADTEGGSSGSPVMLKDGNTVIGIHHSAWTRNFKPDFNAGTLMSFIVPEIQQWLPSSDTAPDLSISQLQLSNDYALPGESLSLDVIVWNQGTAASPSTTLRFYASSDPIITPADTEIAAIPVSALSPNGTIAASTELTAPFTLGIYHYGACVDAVSDDPRPDNDCSTAATLTVTETPTHMYWVNASSLQRATLDGSNVETLMGRFHGFSNLRDIDLDMVNGKVYWIRDGEIRRASLDGIPNVEDVVTGLEGERSIALDVAGGMMYWTNGISVQRATLDGSNVETLIDDVWVRFRIGNIALDMERGKIYWTTSWGNDRMIRRTNLNGSDVEDVVTGLEDVDSIALDLTNYKIYWTDSDAEKIQRANLDGSNVETLATSNDRLASPSGIALDVAGGKMYWTDPGSDEIRRANLDGSNIENLITRGLERVEILKLGIPQSQIFRPIQLSPNALENQSFEVDENVDMAMPVAHGGTPTYTYTLSPDLPSGLQFDAVNRSITGTPTAAMPSTTFTYTATDDASTAAALTFTIEVVGDDPPDPPDSPETPPTDLDVNGDGEIGVLDLVGVAVFYGQRGDDLAADVNKDGVVNVDDFILVAEVVDAQIGNIADIDALWEIINNIAGAPSQPSITALLPNYPNPFNPETWIPYTLSISSEVAIEIYATDGSLVRRLAIGHQAAGFYVGKYRAAYWDGRNTVGEPVASGVYFYTLTAGDFTATRKLLIRK